MDDPTDPDAYGAGRFDAEGLATRRNVLIEDGVLRKFLYNTYAARRAGTASTASAVRAGFKSAPGTGARALMVVPGTPVTARRSWPRWATGSWSSRSPACTRASTR